MIPIGAASAGTGFAVRRQRGRYFFGYIATTV